MMRTNRCLPLLLVGFLLGLAVSTGLSHAQILHTQTGEVIPGTEGIFPGQGVDLAGWNTPGHTLQFANLGDSSLYEASFDGSDLRFANFTGAILQNASFVGTDLTAANFISANLTDADFTNAVIRQTNFYGATGFVAAQFYSTVSYLNDGLSGVLLYNLDLTGWNFSNKNLAFSGFDGSDLTNANFAGANLTNAFFEYSNFVDANFTGAVIKGSYFRTSPSFTAEQLYSTASYANRDLSGTRFSSLNLTGWNFANQNLSGATFLESILVNADFRRTGISLPANAVTRNTIQSNGVVASVQLLAGETLVIRNNLTPVTVQTSVSLDPSSTLQFLLAENWTSPMRFRISSSEVALVGTLELEFAPDANLRDLMGDTFKLFDWTSVTPTGAFTIASPYRWDLSKLYTTGEVTLVPEPTASLVAIGLALLMTAPRRKLL